MTLVRPYCDKYGLVVLELVPQIVDAKQAMLYIEKREMVIVKLKRLIAETCQLLAKTRQLMGEGQGEIAEMLEQTIEFQGSNSSPKKMKKASILHLAVLSLILVGFIVMLIL